MNISMKSNKETEMITIEQACLNGAESSKIAHIDIRKDEISFSFSSEKPFIGENCAYLKITGTLKDFEELYNKAKQAASLIEETF